MYEPMDGRVQLAYQKAARFAAEKHRGQTLLGSSLPYLLHVTDVAMEILLAGMGRDVFRMEFAVQVALLHDVLEDTLCTKEELSASFGVEVAAAVAALSKNPALPKTEQMTDSLARIQRQSREVQSVKLADRITNLQQPPHFWDNEKKQAYRADAEKILQTLAGCHLGLEKRLAQKIAQYRLYLKD